MFNQKTHFLFKVIFLLFIFVNKPFAAETLKKINITGNDRIPSETIKVFSKVSVNDQINKNKINEILKDLYETNYFISINISFENNILNIDVLESPIIYNLKFSGLKSKSIQQTLKDNLNLKERTPYNEIHLNQDKNKIQNILKTMGYFFAKVEIYKEDLDDNKVDITINIDLGDKSKIKKISFIGDKKFKNRKLLSIIVSEENKFWKVISNKKFLNEEIINLDKRLLRNFYLNKGFYQVEINSSFAKLINQNEFELIYNINSGPKIFFGDLSLNLPDDYDEKNFSKILNEFIDLKNTIYSLNKIEKILEKIDKIVLNEQFESINATVEESLVGNKLNLSFNLFEGEKFLVERINIFGNSITSENVIRNQLEIDEGDSFNEILKTKSINNIKSLNFFRTVESEVTDGIEDKSKIINITVEEKPTGEIMAGAGFGTSGSSILFGVKENNFLGNGVSLDANLNLGTESIKGKFSVNNPNYKNTDKAIGFDFVAIETDKLTNSGYKTNKTGFSIATRFEYYDDLYLKIGNSVMYEKLQTDSTASARQKTQEGDYFDGFVKLSIDYDKRNQKFQTTDGFSSFYAIEIPVVSDNYTLTNTYSYKHYTELYEDNITSLSFLFKTANSIKNSDVKLSERLYIPSSRLRGFESGKVGPKDGEDFIGGNILSSLNLQTTIPQILPNNQNTDFLLFLDVANVWGVDYNSSLDDDKIRSSIGIAVDWFTPVGPLTFSLAHPLSKSNNDKVESFRFDLGTTF